MPSVTIAGPAGPLHVVDSPHPGSVAAADPSRAAPVVLVHGMVDDASVWDGLVAHLHAARDGRRIVAVDLRGRGGSAAAADGDHSIDACADDLRAVLDALGLARAVLVGHSYGAFVALALAAREPRRVERLVLVDSPGDFGWLTPQVREEQLDPFVAALAGDGWRDAVTAGFEPALAGSAPDTREAVTARLAAIPQAQALTMYRSMFSFGAVHVLDTYLAAPGARVSAIVTAANAWPFSLHVLRPAVPAVVVPGTGHWLQLDAPAAVAAALDAALDAPAT